MTYNGIHRFIKSGFAALTAIITIFAFQISPAILANMFYIFGKLIHSVQKYKDNYSLNTKYTVINNFWILHCLGGNILLSFINLFHLDMKKFIFSFLLLSIAALNIYAQQGWFWQNPLPQGNGLGRAFISGNNGYIIGHLGTFLKTTNLGSNWIVQYNIPFFELKSSQFLIWITFT